jgi:hypothetical protein
MSRRAYHEYDTTVNAYRLLCSAAVRFGIRRTLHLFDLLPIYLGMRGAVQKLSEHLQTSPATIHRFLRPLMDLGAVVRVQRGVYELDYDALNAVRAQMLAILGLSGNGKH